MGRKPAPMLADFKHQLSTHRIDVYIHEDGVIGYSVLQAQGTSMMLENIAVFPSYTGKGIGSTLIKHSIKVARGGGFHKLTLYTNEKMYENLALYPRFGFQETHRVTEDGFNRVYFELTFPEIPEPSREIKI